MAAYNIDQLDHLFFHAQQENEDRRATLLLQSTLDRIVTGECFRLLCLSRRYNPDGYTSFGVWLTNRTGQQMNGDDRRKICAQMTEVKMICKDWDVIVNNLTHGEMTHVDARRFSINQFYRARKMKFCNDQQRLNGPAPQPLEIIAEYDQDDYQSIMQEVIDTDILGKIAYDEEQAKLICERFRAEVMALCRQ